MIHSRSQLFGSVQRRLGFTWFGVGNAVKIDSVISHIRNLQQLVARKRLLNIEIPIDHIGRTEVWIHGKQ